MKKLFISIVFLVASRVAFGADSRDNLVQKMKPQTAEKLRQKIADKSGRTDRPPFDTFVIEDNLGHDFPISHVSQSILGESEQWMRTLVRPQWLPSDIPVLLRARKDALVREILSPPGFPTTNEIGDFLILGYEIKSHRILLIESGKTLTARIELPEEANLAKVTAKDILKLVSSFFTLPEGVIDPEDINIEGDEHLRVFRWVKGPSSEETSKRYANGERINWWSSLQVFFDGQMLLISIPEIPHPPRFNPGITLQDRF